MLPADVGDDPEIRLEAAVRGFLAMVVGTEAAAAHHAPTVAGRRHHDARSCPCATVAPSGGSPRPWPRSSRTGEMLAVRRIAVAVRAAAGIESLVWLVDIAGMPRDEAVEQMVWSAVAILRRASVPEPA